MTGEKRREKILEIIKNSSTPVSGAALASAMGVSRQVIVQDIALLRANGVLIFSTNRGYLVQENQEYSRVFKVHHTEAQTEEELTLFVDLGGYVKDVFVYHKMYDILKAELKLKSRMDVRNYLKKLEIGSSGLLMNVTSGYHYHTIIADSEEVLDMIQNELEKRGFLAPLQDYEPVDFWKSE